jgi:hypothetical protein
VVEFDWTAKIDKSCEKQEGQSLYNGCNQDFPSFFFFSKLKNEKDLLNIILNGNSFYGLFILFLFQLRQYKFL